MGHFSVFENQHCIIKIICFYDWEVVFLALSYYKTNLEYPLKDWLVTSCWVDCELHKGILLLMQSYGS